MFKIKCPLQALSVTILMLLVGAVSSFAWMNDPGRWPAADRPVNWEYNPTGQVVAPGAPDVAIRAAFDTWENDPGSDFSHFRLANNEFYFCSDCTLHTAWDNHNIVGWHDLGPVRLARCWVRFEPAGLGEIEEADICFNNHPDIAPLWWTGAGAPLAGRIDLQSVALHEVGHFLGLAHCQTRPTYNKVVMWGGGYLTHNRNLLCDDKSGVNYLYPPPGVVGEIRNYAIENAGGCDFGDAPDPLVATIGEYPSLENGEDFFPNGVLDVGLEFDINGNGILDVEDGARHKDSRMEWLGPIGLAAGTALPGEDVMPANFRPKNRVIPAPDPAYIAGAIPPDSIFAVPACATFEPDARTVNLDELDDGVSIRGPFVAGVPVIIDILVCTSGRPPGRYVAGNPNMQLYLNGWEDWNGNGVFGDAGEQVLWWTGTPAVDVGFSPNFLGSTQITDSAWVLTFEITPPAGGIAETVWERFRLDYGEDCGGVPQLWTDPTLNEELGEAKYGEVEDYVWEKNKPGCCQFETYCGMTTAEDCMNGGGTWHFSPPYQCSDTTCQILCGDCNGDGVTNSADVVYLINYLFKGGPAPDPSCVGDVNCDGVVNSADVVYLINYLFKGGPPPCPECCP